MRERAVTRTFLRQILFKQTREGRCPAQEALAFNSQNRPKPQRFRLHNLIQPLLSIPGFTGRCLSCVLEEGHSRSSLLVQQAGEAGRQVFSPFK